MGWLQDTVDGIVDSLSWLPDPIVVIILAFSPLGEVRISVPVAMFVFDMGWGEAAVWSLIGNLAVAPFAAWLYPAAERAIRRTDRGDRYIERLYAKTQARQGGTVAKWKEAAIALFIAIPIPGSGAWTGVLVAHIFGMHWKDSWRYFYAGVVGATALVTFLAATGRAFS